MLIFQGNGLDKDLVTESSLKHKLFLLNYIFLMIEVYEELPQVPKTYFPI